MHGPTSSPAATANLRLKSGSAALFWRGLLVSALLHATALLLWPEMGIADVSIAGDPARAVDVAPVVELPPPPDEIARPRVPILSTDIDVPDDLTVPSTVFRDNPVDRLPPPPSGRGVDTSDQPPFTPYEVSPELRDRAEFARRLERRYPSMLRDAGIGGRVLLHVHIDDEGAVREVRVVETSGYEQMDAAAAELVRAARFRPALNRDQPVAVWIQLPVTFQTR